MRGIQNFGSGLKWLAQDRIWLTRFCRIGAEAGFTTLGEFVIGLPSDGLTFPPFVNPDPTKKLR